MSRKTMLEFFEQAGQQTIESLLEAYYGRAKIDHDLDIKLGVKGNTNSLISLVMRDAIIVSITALCYKCALFGIDPESTRKELLGLFYEYEFEMRRSLGHVTDYDISKTMRLRAKKELLEVIDAFVLIGLPRSTPTADVDESLSYEDVLAYASDPVLCDTSDIRGLCAIHNIDMTPCVNCGNPLPACTCDSRCMYCKLAYSRCICP